MVYSVPITLGANQETVVFNANCPVDLYLIEAKIQITSAAALASVQVRDATGGGGNLIYSSASGTLLGLQLFAPQTAQLAACMTGSTLVIRRSAGGIGSISGIVILTFCPFP